MHFFKRLEIDQLRDLQGCRLLNRKKRTAWSSVLIGASNLLELAGVAAISLLGFEAGAALATVVGVLIEVPGMLLVVRG